MLDHNPTLIPKISLFCRIFFQCLCGILCTMPKKNILYVITNISMPHLVKVGVTDDLDQRLRTFNGKTEMPTRFQVYEAFDDIENPDI